MTERQEKCETFRFVDEDDLSLVCRRSFPLAYLSRNGDQDEFAWWPRVGSDDWCGEWRPKDGV